MRRPGLFGWVVGAAVAVTAVAVAAVLSVIVVDSVAGGSAPVTTCDQQVQVDMDSPQYQNPPGAYAISSVVVSNLDDVACDGQTIRVTLADQGGSSLAEAAEVIDDSTWVNPQTLTLDQAASVDQISDVVVAISSN